MNRHPSTPPVTITQVATAAQVSRQTVSNAISHPSRLRPETLAHVLKVIDDLGYRPSNAAQSLKRQRAGAVGIELHTLGPRSHNETMAPFLGALSLCAPRYAAHMVPFGSTGNRPMLEGYSQMWHSRLVDAFVIADTHHGDPRPAWLAEHGVPFASFGRVWDDPSFTQWVDVDGALGTRIAVDHLVERGYRTIAFLGWPLGSTVGDLRRSGWLAGCAAHGADHQGPSRVAEQDLDRALETARELVSLLEPGDAVVCASDVLALGVHLVLRELGLPAGAIGIVGFDGSELARMHHITTISQPLDLLAEEVLHLVHEALRGAPAPASGTLLAPTLRADATTQPA